MRVLMIAPEPFLEPRGTPISVYQRLHGLSALGHTVDLLTYHVGENVSIAGVTIHRIPSVPFIEQVKVGPSWHKLVLDSLLVLLAIKLLFTNRYDVIHSHEEAAFFSTFLAAFFGVRHVYDMHSSLPQQLVNFDFAAYFPFIKAFEVLERLTLKTCDAVIIIGDDLEAYVRSINPMAPYVTIENLPIQANGHTNGNGNGTIAQLREQLGLQDKLAIVYTGTFERYQGVDLLIDSARVLRTHHKDISFVLVGGKPEQIAHWKHIVQQHQLDDQVLFTGTVPVDEVQPYLDLAEILVSPRTDGLSVPLKIYTYMQSGKPIVATNIHAHTLVLNDETAVLVQPTGEDLAAGFVKLLKDGDLRVRLGKQARHLATEKYGLSNYLLKLSSVYRMLEPAGDHVDVLDHNIQTFEN